MLYVCATPEQTVAVPEIEPGAVAAPEIVTANVRAVDVPQAFCAVTLIVPPVVPVVAVILFVVEVPDQPEGSVQL